MMHFLHMSIRQLMEVVGTGFAYSREGVTVPGILRKSNEKKKGHDFNGIFGNKQSNLDSNFGKFFFVHARILVSGVINLLRSRWRWPNMCSQTSPIPR